MSSDQNPREDEARHPLVGLVEGRLHRNLLEIALDPNFKAERNADGPNLIRWDIEDNTGARVCVIVFLMTPGEARVDG